MGKTFLKLKATMLDVLITFEREVIGYIGKRNVGFSVVLNKTEKKVIEILIENPRFKSIQLSKKNRCSK